MKTITQTSITFAMMLGLTGGALAGDPKTGAMTPAPKKEEPAMKDAKKAPDMAKDAKKMEPMKAPQELADLGKMVVGTWKCTGKAAMDPADMTKMSDMKMTMKMAVDMGGWWIKSTMDAGAMFKGEGFITYDPTAKKFVSWMRDSMGASESKTSAGPVSNKVVWEGDARSPMPGMAAMKVRETHDLSDMKAGVKMTGEYSQDGKKWMTIWEASCKK